MAILCSAQQLEKSFGSHLLFRSLSFGIDSLDRIGLIGPNGAGKSTLLKILAGQIEPDEGVVVRRQGLRVGYLEQSPSFRDGSVYEILSEGLDDYALVQTWMARLSDDQDLSETPVQMLSGGWKKRVAVIRELLKQPDLLLLDEPTNHLDLASILWLEDLLAEARVASVIITHDRLFLERVSSRIFELDRRNPDGLLVVSGAYTQYLEAKEALLASQQKQKEVVQNTFRRETEWLRRGAKARQTKQKARIERAGGLKDQLDDLKSRTRSRSADLDFQSASRHPQKLIAAHQISKSYGSQKLFDPVDVLITPKTRLGLIGVNGSGKSTLIRVLLGLEEPDSGRIEQAPQLQASYFAQHREELKPATTLLQAICPEGDYVNYRGEFVFARSYLDRFLFRPEQMDMPIEKLSGGEKSRLRLAQLMLEKANVLILDEPTNDLDLATLDVLQNSLRDFDGAVILVSHDRYFLDQIANDILAFNNGSLERFASYRQWEEWFEKTGRTEKTKTAASPAPATKPPKLSYKDKRELDGMEAKILKAEETLGVLQKRSEQPDLISDSPKLAALYSEMAHLQKEIERLYSRWAELEKMLP